MGQVEPLACARQPLRVARTQTPARATRCAARGGSGVEPRPCLRNRMPTAACPWPGRLVSPSADTGLPRLAAVHIPVRVAGVSLLRANVRTYPSRTPRSRGQLQPSDPRRNSTSEHIQRPGSHPGRLGTFLACQINSPLTSRLSRSAPQNITRILGRHRHLDGAARRSQSRRNTHQPVRRHIHTRARGARQSVRRDSNLARRRPPGPFDPPARSRTPSVQQIRAKSKSKSIVD